MCARSVYGSRAGLLAGNMKRTERIYVWVNCNAVADADGTNMFPRIETISHRSWDTVAKAKALAVLSYAKNPFTQSLKGLVNDKTKRR